jgi:sulfur-carrier protein adenylyltransferase/sulfurtransferase
MQSDLPEISVRDLKPLLDAGSAYLIDVREPDEHLLSCIPGSHLLPLSQLADRLQEVPRGVPVYVHCRSGMRSAKAIRLLEKHGISNAINVAGGIAAWAKEFDPAMPL